MIGLEKPLDENSGHDFSHVQDRPRMLHPRILLIIVTPATRILQFESLKHDQGFRVSSQMHVKPFKTFHLSIRHCRSVQRSGKPFKRLKLHPKQLQSSHRTLRSISRDGRLGSFSSGRKIAPKRGQQRRAAIDDSPFASLATRFRASTRVMIQKPSRDAAQDE
jgi:hypothetical protein